MGLPDAWVANIPQQSGFVWDVAGSADQSNGHCFEAIGYGPDGMTIVTWGLVGYITWAALAAYAAPPSQGEAWIRISQAQIGLSGLSGAGYDWTQTCTFFNAMGGSVVVPPSPAPTPVPPPPVPVPPSPVPVPTPVPVPVPPSPPVPVPPAPVPPPSPTPIPPPTADVGTWNPHTQVITLPNGWTAGRGALPQIIVYPYHQTVGVPKGWIVQH